MSDLILPAEKHVILPEVEVPGGGRVDCWFGGWSEHFLPEAERIFHEIVAEPIEHRGRELAMAGGASFSNYWSKAVLDAIFKDPDITDIAAGPYLTLCSSVPTDDLTGATLVEIAYTTYARKIVVAADMSAASGTTTATKTNTAVETFGACTAGGATAIGWAITDNATVGAGNHICWGTCTSTVISTTQTPPTVAVGAIVVNLD